MTSSTRRLALLLLWTAACGGRDAHDGGDGTSATTSATSAAMAAPQSVDDIDNCTGAAAGPPPLCEEGFHWDDEGLLK